MGIPSIPPARRRPEQEEKEIAHLNNTATPLVMPTEQSIREIVEQEVRRHSWGVTTREAADALISAFGGGDPFVMTGDGPVRITDRWGSVLVGHIEPMVGDSSSGIEPCGYEEL